MDSITSKPAEPVGVIRKAARVIGRVQGVNFRVFVKNSAKSVGVTGWVKNMNDGSVAMELQGNWQAIEQLIEKIKKGSGRINVTSLELADLPVAKGESEFAIRK